ncbi:MAG: glycosyltransferase family 2 protein [Thermoproteota archaeon]
MGRVAILIPNYNGFQILKMVFLQSLESALKIKTFSKHAIDIYLIDNGSSDNSIDIVRNKFAEIKVIELRKNYGFAGALYKAIKSIGVYDYVVIMNNDYVVINEEALDQLIKSIKNKANICVAQGINIYPNNLIEDCGFFYNSFLSVIPRWRNIRYSEYPEKPSYVTYASFAFALLKLKRCPPLLHRKWILDPKFFGYYDDADIQLYLWTYGFKSLALPILVGIHYESETFKRMSILRSYLSTRNMVIILNTYWRYYLSSYRAVLMIRHFISNLYKAVLNRTEYFRGLYDSFHMKRKLILGPYYPLIFVVKSMKRYFKEFMPDAIRWNLIINRNRGIYEEFSRKFVQDNDLKLSTYPYLIVV